MSVWKRGVLAFVGAFMGLAVIGAPAASAGETASVKERADKIMNLSYKKFAKADHSKPFDWRNNGCSSPLPYTPFQEVFRRACNQHDFGYRNYGSATKGGLKLSPTRATKNRIDGKFALELKRTCEDTYAVWNPQRHACLTAGGGYYTAVSQGGDGHFFK